MSKFTVKDVQEIHNELKPLKPPSLVLIEQQQKMKQTHNTLTALDRVRIKRSVHKLHGPKCTCSLCLPDGLEGLPEVTRQAIRARKEAMK